MKVHEYNYTLERNDYFNEYPNHVFTIKATYLESLLFCSVAVSLSSVLTYNCYPGFIIINQIRRLSQVLNHLMLD